jgi:hypothetical protein
MFFGQILELKEAVIIPFIPDSIGSARLSQNEKCPRKIL